MSCSVLFFNTFCGIISVSKSKFNRTKKTALHLLFFYIHQPKRFKDKIKKVFFLIKQQNCASAVKKLHQFLDSLPLKRKNIPKHHLFCYIKQFFRETWIYQMFTIQLIVIFCHLTIKLFLIDLFVFKHVHMLVHVLI